MERRYITEESQNIIRGLAWHRSKQEIIHRSNELYDIIKADIDIALTSNGGEWITRTIDRNIGKTYAIIKLACEYGLPIAVGSRNIAKIYESNAKEWFNKDIRLVDINMYRTIPVRDSIVLKDEGTSIKKIREALGNNVKIVGISSFFDD